MSDNEARLYQIVGARIREKRTSGLHQLSQAQLAAKLGLSRASLVNIEAGRQRPPLHILWRIAEVLDTEAASLIPWRSELGSNRELDDLDQQIAAEIAEAGADNPDTMRDLLRFVHHARTTHAQAKTSSPKSRDRGPRK